MKNATVSIFHLDAIPVADATESEPVEAPSSRSVGILAITLCSVICTCIVTLDLLSLLQHGPSGQETYVKK